MTTQYKERVGVGSYYDDVTWETTLPIYPVYINEDFIGTHSSLWTIMDMGDGTSNKVPNVANGQWDFSITDSTSNEQEIGFFWNDLLEINIDKNPIIEFKLRFTIAPTGLTEVFFGLCNEYVIGPMSTGMPTFHVLYGCDSTGEIRIWTDDGTNVNTAVSIDATSFVDIEVEHIYRIDCTDLTNVLFYIDGQAKATTTIFNISSGSNILVQPYIYLYKPSAIGVATIRLDYIKLWSNR